MDHPWKLSISYWHLYLSCIYQYRRAILDLYQKKDINFRFYLTSYSNCKNWTIVCNDIALIFHSHQNFAIFLFMITSSHFKCLFLLLWDKLTYHLRAQFCKHTNCNTPCRLPFWNQYFNNWEAFIMLFKCWLQREIV